MNNEEEESIMWGYCKTWKAAGSNWRSERDQIS